MAVDNPKNYVDLLISLPPDSIIDPKLIILFVTSLLTRVNSLENVLNEKTQELIGLKNNFDNLEKRVNFQEKYSSNLSTLRTKIRFSEGGVYYLGRTVYREKLYS